jgi:hypothetical protein
VNGETWNTFIIGELVAIELLDGTETNLLADFRPEVSFKKNNK